MTTEQVAADIESVMRANPSYCEYVAGGTGDEETWEAAEEWADEGFDADDALAWWEAGAFDASRTAELRDAGLTPEMCKENNVAHDYSNGDITLDKAILKAHDAVDYVPDGLEWLRCPADGGQIVDVTYAADEDYLYCRRHDRSDNSVSISRCRIADEADEDLLRFEPWNGILPETEGNWEDLLPVSK